MTRTTRTHNPAMAPSQLLAADLLRLGANGLRTRPTRAILSSIGIAIGIAAMIAVVGISTSSQATLNNQINALGTNLLTAAPAKLPNGETATLSPTAAAQVALLDGVTGAASLSTVPHASVFRNQFINKNQTAGITTASTQLNLLTLVGATIKEGHWLTPATERAPSVVLGSKAAHSLGISGPGDQVLVGGHYLTVTGILNPVVLTPELDYLALIGTPLATDLYHSTNTATAVYERSSDGTVAGIRTLLAPTISPQNPGNVLVSRPSDVLAAKAAIDQTFTGLLLGLGSVALLVGGIGVANTMIISVLERRREIGLRRALGAARTHIATQFLIEAALLSAGGGLIGVLLGYGATAAYTATKQWPLTIPAEILAAALIATILIGAIAGIYPAIRAARTPPALALSR